MHSNLCGNPKEVRHELDLPLNLTSAYSRNLPLPNHVHRCVSPDCSPRCVETEEAESGIDSTFYESAVVLDEAVEIFTLPQLSAVGKRSFFLSRWNHRNQPRSTVPFDRDKFCARPIALRPMLDNPKYIYIVRASN